MQRLCVRPGRLWWSLVVALALLLMPAGKARAQFMGYGGYGFGYPGWGYGGWGGYGYPGGYYNYGYPFYGMGNFPVAGNFNIGPPGFRGYGMGYGGYGGYGMGYGGYGGYGMGYGGYGGYGMGYGGYGGYGMGYAGYGLTPGGIGMSGVGYFNPAFGVGLTPLGTQSFFVESRSSVACRGRRHAITTRPIEGIRTRESPRGSPSERPAQSCFHAPSSRRTATIWPM